MEQTKLELYALEQTKIDKKDHNGQKMVKGLRLYFGSEDSENVYTMNLNFLKFDQNIGEKGDYVVSDEQFQKTSEKVKEFFGVEVANLETAVGQEFDLYLYEKTLSAYIDEPNFKEYTVPTTSQEGKSLTMRIIGGQITKDFVRVEFQDIKNPEVYYQKMEWYKPYGMKDEDFDKIQRKIGKSDKVAKMGRMLDRKKYEYETENFTISTFEKIMEELSGVEIIATVGIYDGNPFIDFAKANVLKTAKEVKQETQDEAPF